MSIYYEYKTVSTDCNKCKVSSSCKYLILVVKLIALLVIELKDTILIAAKSTCINVSK